jgi:hypothetical protein
MGKANQDEVGATPQHGIARPAILADRRGDGGFQPAACSAPTPRKRAAGTGATKYRGANTRCAI